MRGSIASCGDDEDGVPIKKSKEIGAVLNDEALDQVTTQQHNTIIYAISLNDTITYLILALMRNFIV